MIDRFLDRSLKAALERPRSRTRACDGKHWEYSRFWETRAGDRARSALRGVGRSQSTYCKQTKPLSLTGSASECPLLAAKQKCRERVAMSLNDPLRTLATPRAIRPRLIPPGARSAPIDLVILEIAQRRVKDWRADAGSRGRLDEIAYRASAFSGPTILHTDWYGRPLSRVRLRKTGRDRRLVVVRHQSARLVSARGGPRAPHSRWQKSRVTCQFSCRSNMR
jgi:hypothetical protein